MEDSTPESPKTFVLVFVVIMLVCFGFYLLLVSKLNLNVNKFKRLSSDSSLVVLLFFVAILAVFALLVIFWVHINLLQALTYVSAAVIPFFVLGNAALNRLAD